MKGDGLALSALGYGPVAGFCEKELSELHFPQRTAYCLIS